MPMIEGQRASTRHSPYYEVKAKCDCCCHVSNQERSLAPASLGGEETLCQATKHCPSSPMSKSPSMPFERLSVSTAWVGVCTIGLPTFSDVLTDTSTPTLLPIALR